VLATCATCPFCAICKVLELFCEPLRVTIHVYIITQQNQCPQSLPTFPQGQMPNRDGSHMGSIDQSLAPHAQPVGRPAGFCHFVSPLRRRGSNESQQTKNR
jgi:hypothetical protein